MLICEDLFLLLTTDEGGTESWVSYRDYGLAAALLADLTFAGCLEVESTRWSTKVSLAPEVEEPSSAGSPGSGTDGGDLDPGGTPSTGSGDDGAGSAGPGTAAEALRGQSPALAFGLDALAGRKPTAMNSLVVAGWFNPRAAIVEGLTSRGIVGVEEKRMLGLVPEKHPTLDPRPETETRSRLAAALAGTGDVAAPDAVLLNILKGMNAAWHVLKQEAEAAGLRGGKVNKRIGEIAAGFPEDAQSGGKAVASAIEGVNAGITAAIAASTTTASSSN